MSMPSVSVEVAFGVLPGEIPKLHLRLPGESGDYASTSDSASLDITGDIDLRAVVSVADWSTASGGLIGKAASSQFSYYLSLVDGRIRMSISDTGTTTYLADSDSLTFTPHARRGIRATWRASDGRVQFFTSDDEGATWIQLGSNGLIDTPAAIHSGTAEVSIGGGTAISDLTGRVYEAKVISDPFGTPVEQANPDFTDTVEWSAGDTTGSDAAGNTWTVNQSGSPQAEVRDDWEDLTSRVGYPGGISWSVGRFTERDQADAGTGSVTFDNSDRALDPTNEASPYWPQIRPMTRMRVRATHNAVTYPVLEGFARAWPPRWAGSEYGYVTVPLVDGFKLLSLARTSASYSQEASGTRVGNLLDAAGWPAGRRDLDTGQSNVQAYTASDRIVLNAIRDTATAESGVFFIGPNGDAIFRDRFSRIVSSSQATFGEDPGEVFYEDIDISHDEGEVWNDISVTPVGLTVQRSTDDTSMDLYGHRWFSRPDSLITTEAEASDAANWLLRRYRDARTRIDRLTLRGDLFDTTLTQVLARGIGDRITVRTQPAGGGAQIEQEVFIEHITHRITADTWETSWQLSPAFSESVWLIGLSGFSEIGETTHVGY